MAAPTIERFERGRPRSKDRRVQGTEPSRQRDAWRPAVVLHHLHRMTVGGNASRPSSSRNRCRPRNVRRSWQPSRIGSTRSSLPRYLRSPAATAPVIDAETERARVQPSPGAPSPPPSLRRAMAPSKSPGRNRIASGSPVNPLKSRWTSTGTPSPGMARLRSDYSGSAPMKPMLIYGPPPWAAARSSAEELVARHSCSYSTW